MLSGQAVTRWQVVFWKKGTGIVKEGGERENQADRRETVYLEKVRYFANAPTVRAFCSSSTGL